MDGLDTDAIQAKKAKTLILRQAAKEAAVPTLYFYHSIHTKAGKLSINKSNRYELTKLKSGYSIKCHNFF